MLTSTLQFGPELVLALVLIFVFTLRFRVQPRAFISIKVPATRVWQLLAPYDRKVEQWGNTRIITSLLSTATQSYAITYETTQNNGVVRSFHAQFRLAESVENKLLVLKREGLEGKSTRNELLEIRHEITPQGEAAARLCTTYVWGSRPLLAQLLARADLWGGIYRIKGLAETGIPNNRPYWIINGLVAFVTALFSIAALSLLLSWISACVLVFALLVHEFGHLLAFRLIGQPWGRMIFLPFLGAVAVPRLPFESQAQSVFSALMGPGFSIFLALACFVPYLLDWPSSHFFIAVGALTTFLNVFNMLPAEPLDGGIALRSILTRLVGDKTWAVLIGVGFLVMGWGFFISQTPLLIFGVLAILANLWRRKIDSGLTPLTSLQVSLAFGSYVAIAGAHTSMMTWFFNQLSV